jgi:hypothetical protein
VESQPAESLWDFLKVANSVGDLFDQGLSAPNGYAAYMLNINFLTSNRNIIVDRNTSSFPGSLSVDRNKDVLLCTLQDDQTDLGRLLPPPLLGDAPATSTRRPDQRPGLLTVRCNRQHFLLLCAFNVQGQRSKLEPSRNPGMRFRHARPQSIRNVLYRQAVVFPATCSNPNMVHIPMGRGFRRTTCRYAT